MSCLKFIHINQYKTNTSGDKYQALNSYTWMQGQKKKKKELIAIMTITHNDVTKQNNIKIIVTEASIHQSSALNDMP